MFFTLMWLKKKKKCFKIVKPIEESGKTVAGCTTEIKMMMKYQGQHQRQRKRRVRHQNLKKSLGPRVLLGNSPHICLQAIIWICTWQR